MISVIGGKSPLVRRRGPQVIVRVPDDRRIREWTALRQRLGVESRGSPRVARCERRSVRVALFFSGAARETSSGSEWALSLAVEIVTL